MVSRRRLFSSPHSWSSPLPLFFFFSSSNCNSSIRICKFVHRNHQLQLLLRLLLLVLLLLLLHFVQLHKNIIGNGTTILGVHALPILDAASGNCTDGKFAPLSSSLLPPSTSCENDQHQQQQSSSFVAFPINANANNIRLHLLLLNNNNSNHMSLIQPLNAHFEQFFAVENSIEQLEWQRALPTKWERHEMRKLILLLFHVRDFTLIASNPHAFLHKHVPLLAKFVQLTFLDQNRYCVIHEQLPAEPGAGRFPRFWGYTVLRSGAHSARPFLHHSAPHFQSDGNVCNQVSALFERSGSRSLTIAGASRFAVRGKYNSSCQKGNSLADAAHNNETMFHAICTALMEASKIGNNADDDAIFVQWHGMAETSCVESMAFMSVGANGSHPIYRRPNAAVNKIVAALNNLTGTQTAATPMDDAGRECPLIASTNVFGRLVNGVRSGQTCSLHPKWDDIKGQFIHVEQKRAMRNDWELWANALRTAFPTSRRINNNSSRQTRTTTIK